jgi:hypothetical protein
VLLQKLSEMTTSNSSSFDERIESLDSSSFDERIESLDSSPFIERIETCDSAEEGLGYKFIMNDSSFNISCKIQNESLCCERYGAHTDSAQFFDTFIGAILVSFEIGEVTGDDDSDMSKLEVHIVTDRGTITIVFFNEHNGYYPHDVSIHSESINKIVSL